MTISEKLNWDTLVCTGCLHVGDKPKPPALSCCPERKPVSLRDLVTAYETRAQSASVPEDAKLADQLNILRNAPSWSVCGEAADTIENYARDNAHLTVERDAYKASQLDCAKEIERLNYHIETRRLEADAIIKQHRQEAEAAEARLAALHEEYKLCRELLMNNTAERDEARAQVASLAAENAALQSVMKQVQSYLMGGDWTGDDGVANTLTKALSTPNPTTEKSKIGI